MTISISACKTFFSQEDLVCMERSRERLCLIDPLDLRIQKEENLILVMFFYRCIYIYILVFISTYYKICILKLFLVQII